MKPGREAFRRPVRAASGVLLPLVAVTAITAGCADRQERVSAPAARPAPPPALHDGPLTDYVPAAGLRWLIIGRPMELAGDSAFVEALRPLFSERRLQAFTQTTGVDLRKTPSALAAGFDFGTLYMAETPRENERVEVLFTDRLLHGATVERPHPKLHRVSGMIGKTPQTLVRIDHELIAVSVGDPTPARVVEAFARRRLSRSPSALRGTALAALPPALEREPLCVYAPGPFEGEWRGAARGLLAGATALGAGIRPRGESLRVILYLAGTWRDVPDAGSRLTAAWADLTQSPLGSLLGLRSAATAPAVEVTPDLLIARVELQLPPFARGLHTAVAGETWKFSTSHALRV